MLGLSGGLSGALNWFLGADDHIQFARCSKFCQILPGAGANASIC